MTKKAIIKSNKRVKDAGEVFTPIGLVDEMLEKLPQEVFTNPEKTFIDPACGDGNFLVRVLERKIQNGSTPLQALQTIYGIDIMPDNIDECRRRLFASAMKANNNLVDKAWREPLLDNIRFGNSLERTPEEILTEDRSIAQRRKQIREEILELDHEIDPLLQRLEELQKKREELIEENNSFDKTVDNPHKSDII